ncbi:MAG: hypothetical protein LBS23_03610, partial [Holosporaceae bacterium]|nr:hypothetical protein [Holosporaceae bacterium]
MFKKIVFACCALSAMSGCDRVQQNGTDQIIPRSVLQANPDKFCVSMNHAGDKIAYLARKGNRIELRVEDLCGHIIIKFEVKESLGAYHLIWAYTNEHILIEQDKNGDENDHVICLDVKTGNSKDLTPFEGAKSSVEKLSRKYPYDVIVFSNKNDPKWFDAYRINIVTGKVDLVFRNSKYISFIFDHDFKLRLLSEMITDGSCNIYLVKNGKNEFFKKIPYEDTKNTNFMYFHIDNKIVYAVDSVGRDKCAFVSYDLSDGTSKILFESNLADVEGFTYDPKTFAPQCFCVEYLKPEIFVADKSIEKDIAYLKPQAQGRNLNIISRNDTDDVWLISYSCSNSCQKYYLYKRNPEIG